MVLMLKSIAVLVVLTLSILALMLVFGWASRELVVDYTLKTLAIAVILAGTGALLHVLARNRDPG